MLEGETGKFVEPMQVRLLLHRDGSKDVSSAIMDKAELEADDQRQTEKGLPAVCFSGKQVDPRNAHLYHKTTERKLYVEEGSWPWKRLF